MATYVYCTGHVNSPHVNPKNRYILQRYKRRIRELEFKFFSEKKKVYGISVNDMHAHKTISDLWK
jgi:hypothetical protein